jgi:hypothetical protein
MEYAYLLKAQPFIREHLQKKQAEQSQKSSNNDLQSSKK